MEEQLKFDAEDIFCDDPAAIAALENFGIKYLYPWQRLVIANILDAFMEQKKSKNEDDQEPSDCLGKQIVLLPTGAGKSLCFQIPALLLEGPTLVIYPLLALMSDQHRRMLEGGMSVVIFKGGQTEEEREENFRLLENGAKIIIANPEVLSSDSLLSKLSKCNISHIAIDEAHCVSEWGDTFRPAYLELGAILNKLNVPVVTAFTATASPEVLSRISDVLFNGEAHIVRSESDRPNIHYYVKKVAAKKQAAVLLAGTEPRPMIIFCSSRNRTEDMAQELNTVYGKGTAKFYHAGLSREEKTATEEWFFKRKDVVLCATCAYGMGVDKKDIHTVVHLDPPETAEAYIQEAGRGGRDGSIANALLLWNQEDRIHFAEYKPGSRKAALREMAENESCRRQSLLDALGAEKAVCEGCDYCESQELKKNTSGKNNAFRIKSRIVDFIKISEKHLQEKRMPGDSLPSELDIALRLIQFFEKYFTIESFETFLLKYLNRKTRPLIGLNIWEHTGYCAIMNQLLSQRKIKICRFPWKGRLMATNKKKRRNIILRLILKSGIRFIRHHPRLRSLIHHRLYFRLPRTELEQVQEQPSSS